MNINKTDSYGFTLLHDAAHYNEVDTVKSLIAAGADINAVAKNGWTPLVSSFSNVSSLQSALLLIAAGAKASDHDIELLEDNIAYRMEVAQCHDNRTTGACYRLQAESQAQILSAIRASV